MKTIPLTLVLSLFWFGVIAQTGSIPIDTAYLPLKSFKMSFRDRSWIDSAGAYVNIEFLLAFEEPPIYCCQADSVIRILTIPSFDPSTLIEVYKKDSKYFVRAKTSSKVGLDNSYIDETRINRKDRKRLYQLEHDNIPQSQWSEADYRIYNSVIVKDTVQFKYSVHDIEITAADWASIFTSITPQFYKLQEKAWEFRATMDGYRRMIEVVTNSGYMVIERGSDFPEEPIVQELSQKIEEYIN